MSNLVRFPNLREAREQASLWVVRLDRGLAPEEQAELRTWSASALNRRALRDMTALWTDLDKLGALAEVFPREERRAPRRRRLWWVAAAVVALAGAVVVGGQVLREIPW